MKIVPKRRPAEHVNPELPPERIGRMWSVIEATQAGPVTRRRARFVVVATAAVLLLAGVGGFYAWREPGLSVRRASQGERIVAEARATDLSLPDGTSLALSRASTLSVLETSDHGRTRLRVDRGSVRFDVPHREGREFVVEARDVRVVVRGTRFIVEVKESPAGSEIQVGVERGRVEVQDRKGHIMSTLHPNQSWSMQLPPLNPTSSPPPPKPEPEPEPKPEPEPDLSPPPAPSPSSPLAPAISPSSLLERANQARIEGHAREAADAYERLYTRYPRDPRAGLAAFELARIQLDSLHDAWRAEVALRFALRHNQGGFAADDAAALRVDALSRLGDLEACQTARASFLAKFPASAQLKRVLAACPE